MTKYFFFLLPICHLLGNISQEDIVFNATLYNEPSTVINGCVNAVTGEHFIHEVDYVAEAFEPIKFTRSYLSSQQKDKQPLWEYFPHLELKIFDGDDRRYLKVFHESGTLIVLGYDYEKKLYKSVNLGQFSGYTHASQSGRDHPANCWAIEYEDGHAFQVVYGDGTQLVYRLHKGRYFLKQLQLPNGVTKGFLYDGDRRIVRLTSKGKGASEPFAVIDIEHETPKKEGLNFKIKHHGKTVVSYIHDKKIEEKHHSFIKKMINPFSYVKPTKIAYNYLDTISFVLKPQESYGYDQMKPGAPYLLTKRDFCDGRYYFIDYYPEGEVTENRVSHLSEPVGPHHQCIKTHRFSYTRDGCSEVFDSKGNKIAYYYSKDLRLQSITKHQGDGPASYKKQFTWSPCGDLLSTEVFDEDQVCVQKVHFTYDSHHNVISETLTGNLTGGSHTDETYTINYTYTSDGLNLLQSKTLPNGYREVYSYLPKTNLVTAKFIYDGDSLKIRNLFEYNNNYVLIKEMTDNGSSLQPNDLQGVTKRRIREIYPRKTAPALYCPELVVESFTDDKGDHLLRKTRYVYNRNNQVTQEQIFDSEEKLVCTLHTSYDKRRRQSLRVDALGRKTHYEYDNQNNLIAKDSEENDYLETYHYDTRNRQVGQAQNKDDLLRQTQMQYDTCGNIVSTTDLRSHQTSYVYNHLLQPILSILPKTCDNQERQIRRKFNALGFLLEETDPDGHTITKRYNARGDPIQVIHPDGSEEKYLYFTNGNLKTHITKSGLEVHYSYDFLDREVSVKNICSENVLSEQYKSYDSFDLLTENTNGLITYYQYDGVSRLLHKKCGLKKTSFEYDTLGRLAKTIYWLDKDAAQVHLTQYDLAERITQETKTDLDGKIYENTTRSYDRFDNLISLTQHNNKCSATYSFSYDPFGRVTKKIDPLGNTVETTYLDWFKYGNQTVLKKIVTNPKKVISATICDGDERVLMEEKPGLNTLYRYSPGGDKVEEHCTTDQKQITRRWSYDSCHRVKQFIDADSQVTTYTHTPAGHVATKTKSDGVVLTYTYSPMGYLTGVRSNDLSIDYSYTHDAEGHVLEATDHIQNKCFCRTYDPHGNILTEDHITKTYDSLDRLLSIRFLDHVMHYTYDPFHLLTASLDNLTHHFLEYDLNHRLLQESTIHSGGIISHMYDILGRQHGCASPYHTDSIQEYDPNSNPIERTLTNAYWEVKETYSYDDLDQLLHDSSHSYAYDTLYNRLKIDHLHYAINSLNQIARLNDTPFQYDNNGNLLTTPSYVLSYDALDRITAIQTPSTTLYFTYDPFNRRIQKNQESYLYLDHTEIASYATDGSLLTCRLITPEESPRTLLIHINGYSYAALNDLFGNIHGLVYNRQLYHTHRYTPFGETISLTQSLFYTVNNPYQYQSKRADPETGFLDFGNRFYSPYLGRWLSPDPAGYCDAPNLYHFLKNNPFAYTDPSGLKISFANTSYRKAFEATEQPDWWTYSWSPRVTGVDGWVSDQHEVLIIGGMNTHPEEMKQRVNATSSYNGSMRTFGFASANTDAIIDSGTTLLSMIPKVDTSQKVELRMFCESVLASGKDIKIFAHSKGGAVAYGALTPLSKEQKERISIVTFGAPLIFKEAGFASTTNYISALDILGFFLGGLGNRTIHQIIHHPECVILKPTTLNPSKEHRFNHTTYYRAFERELSQLRQQ